MNSILKSISYCILLAIIFVSCQNEPTEKQIGKSCREIKLSVFDESLMKSMPLVEIKLDDIQISLISLHDTTICLELGKHRVRIKDTKSDSIYLESEIIVTENKDLLWIRFDEQPTYPEYQQHFSYWKLIDTLTKTDPSNNEFYQQLRIELLIEGQLPDSIISKHQQLYNGILKDTLLREISPKTNEFKQMGFSILYHQTMKI